MMKSLLTAMLDVASEMELWYNNFENVVDGRFMKSIGGKKRSLIVTLQSCSTRYTYVVAYSVIFFSHLLF